MSVRSCLAIVLAAGEGTRMRSTVPKVLHAIAGRSMLAHVLRAVAGTKATAVAVVVGPNQDTVLMSTLVPSSLPLVSFHHVAMARIPETVLGMTSANGPVKSAEADMT